MTQFVAIDGRFVRSSDVQVSSFSSFSLYGKGVFTTIAISQGEPVFWEKHWRRLAANATTLGLDLSQFEAASARDTLVALIKKNQLASGRARITFSDESPSRIWCGDGGRNTLLSIITNDRRKAIENIKLTASPHRINTTSPLAAVKSCNYLEPLMSFQEAKTRVFDEAIRLNERGEVTSACMANLFWLKGGRLHTPSLETGCLAGTTREFVIENLECEEIEAGVQSLQEADEIFLTSAGIGVVQAAEFDGRKLRLGDHPIKRILPF